MKNKYYETQTIIPIYDSRVYLVVCEDITALKNNSRYGNVFANEKEVYLEYTSALVACSPANTFYIFLQKDIIDIQTIAHEMFHLTVRLLDIGGCVFDLENHEHYACLNGYLMNWVTLTLKKWNLKV